MIEFFGLKMFGYAEYGSMSVVVLCLFSLKSKNSHVITQFGAERH